MQWPGFDLYAELLADVERRFWSRVTKTETCWIWTGRTTDGYGRMRVGRKEWIATAISWALHVGPVPAGALLCHTCDNPPCVRPGHLYLGDHSTNAIDAIDRSETWGGRPVSRRRPRRVRLPGAAPTVRRDFVPEPVPFEFQPRRRADLPRGALGARWFTDDEVRAIRSAPAQRGVVVQLAAHFNVSRQAIHEIRSRKTYAEVPDLPAS